MRIAVIAPPWTPIPPVSYGGIEAVVDQLAVGFQRAGHDVLLFATGDSTCPVPRHSTLATADLRLGMAVPELLHISAAYEAVDDFDVVHDHTLVGPFCVQLGRRQVVVTTAHGPLDGELGPLYHRLGDGVQLIAVSNAQARSAPAVKVTKVIHHGVDIDYFPNGKGEGDYCLFLGRMTPEKGAHRAIAAARRAGLPLQMAAKCRESAEREYFEKFVEPELGDDAVYLGEVSNEDKLELLASARALLFPIRWNEPFGMVMIEALACGTPVLAFPEGAVPEVVENGTNGFLCADEEAMADALGHIDRIDRAACRADVERRFSTDRMVGDHLELFDTLLRR
jgi:glycosyltransferase involved in cell wall biosynthesis